MSIINHTYCARCTAFVCLCHQPINILTKFCNANRLHTHILCLERLLRRLPHATSSIAFICGQHTVRFRETRTLVSNKDIGLLYAHRIHNSLCPSVDVYGYVFRIIAYNYEFLGTLSVNRTESIDGDDGNQRRRSRRRNCTMEIMHCDHCSKLPRRAQNQHTHTHSRAHTTMWLDCCVCC